MKPLIPAYVARGIAAIDTVAMKSTIKACFYADSFIGEARKLETYERAKLKYSVLAAEIPIPEKRKTKEDLGPIADDTPEAGAVDGIGIYDLKLGDVAEDPTEFLEDEHAPEEDDQEQEANPPPPPSAKKTRKRKASAVEIAAQEEEVVPATKVSKKGRAVNPSTVRGSIVPNNRCSTIV